jgi:predicted nucleic acid-binding protein
VKRGIVDTGPIVAFLNTRDPRHGWACEMFDSFKLNETAVPATAEPPTK